MASKNGRKLDADTIQRMRQLAEILKRGETTLAEAYTEMNMDKTSFYSLLTPMTEHYLIYQEKDRIGILNYSCQNVKSGV